MRSTDLERARYVRTYFGCDWKDPHLYNMMISSQLGIEAAAGMIIEVLRTSDVLARVRISIPIQAR
jgi:hypothetical protein